MRPLRRFRKRRLQSFFLPSALACGNFALSLQRYGRLRLRRLAGFLRYFFRHKGGLLQSRAGHKYAQIPARPYFILWQGKRSSNNQKQGSASANAATALMRAMSIIAAEHANPAVGPLPAAPKRGTVLTTLRARRC